jgi:hypothetical protein
MFPHLEDFQFVCTSTVFGTRALRAEIRSSCPVFGVGYDKLEAERKV